MVVARRSRTKRKVPRLAFVSQAKRMLARDDSVWWNADEMRGTDGKAPSVLGSLISLVLTLAGLRWKVKPT